jgi:hypothetical protein
VSNPAVEWTLAQLQSVVDAQPAEHPLERIDRDDSQLLEGNIRSRTRELQRGNYVGAAHADRSAQPEGPEYDLDVDVVVGVRIEGLHHAAKGHIDPDSTDGVTFAGDGGLVEQIRNAIYAGRREPAAGRSSVAFTHLEITNEAPQSRQYADYYRYDFDVVFEGFESL